MKKTLPILILFLLGAVLFSACVNESPEPLYTPEEIKPEDRVKIGSEDANGISFDLYNDLTAEIAGFDADGYSENTISLPEKYDRYRVIAIGDGVFEGAELMKITIPNSIKTIGDGAFKKSAITEIAIPDSVESIGKDCFDNCLFLEKAVIGKGVEIIPTGAFFSCRSLKEITLSEGVLEIGEEAFASLPSLEKIHLPNSLEVIDAYAFWNSGNDTLEFSIPKGVKKIGQSAFRETAWLKGKTEEFVIEGNGILIDYNGTETKVFLPEGIFYLSDAFAFTEVASLALNSDLLKIDAAAFEETKISSLSYEGDREEIRKITEKF